MFVHRYPAMEPETQPDNTVSLTTRMWWKLLTRPMLPPRSRVLVVGSRPLDVIELLLDLAYDVSGLCLTAEAVLVGRRTLPIADFQLWKPGAYEHGFEAPFDLVLITDFQFGNRNLYDLSSRLETSALLATMKPQGRCLTLCAGSANAAHSSACWQRHLDCFPGECQTEQLIPAWWRTWQARWNRQTLPKPVHAVTLKIPDMPMTLGEWKSFARAGLLTGKGACCPSAQLAATQIASEIPQRRVA